MSKTITFENCSECPYVWKGQAGKELVYENLHVMIAKPYSIDRRVTVNKAHELCPIPNQ